MRASDKVSWSEGERASFGVVGLSLLGCTLWDFYIQGVGLRPFDILTVIGLIAAAASAVGGRFLLNERGGRRVAFVWIIVVLYAVVGTAADVDNARPVIGFLTGAVAFALATMLPIASPRVLVAATTLCILVHGAAFWLQMGVYYGTGILINYQLWLGGDPRLFGTAFRAAGMFLEPANFGITMFLLVTLRIHVLGKFDRVAAFALLSSCASFSLWGIFSSVVLLVFMGWRTKTFWIICLLGLFVAIAALPALDDLSNSFWVAKRVMSLGTDSSSSARYGVLLPSLANLLWDPATWFGAGITDDYQLFGSSGLGFLIRALGLMGLVGFLLGICAGAPRGQKVFTTAVTAVALTAATFWTYMFWWFWLALMLRKLSIRTPRGLVWNDELTPGVSGPGARAALPQ